MTDLDLFLCGVLFTSQFDVATGEKEYAIMKAYDILRLVMLSEYWREIFSSFFFTANLNGEGVDLDLLFEYVHKNVKARMRSVGHLPSFKGGTQSLQVGLKEDVITKANEVIAVISVLSPTNLFLRGNKTNSGKVVLH